ncbi:MAG: sulfatase-like hydrolase/transferase [Verrucomicrobiales bacterium]|nr:sulfatase-like hydrolase/transferase [Verrucomicrobiales bacterium]
MPLVSPGAIDGFDRFLAPLNQPYPRRRASPDLARITVLIWTGLSLITGWMVPLAQGAAPTIEPVADVTLDEDTPSGPIILHASDPDTAGGLLQIRVTPVSNGALVEGGLSLTGIGAERTLIIIPTRNQSGTATLRVQVSDPTGASATDEFDVHVNPVNDSPVLDLVSGTSFQSVAGENTRLTVRVADVDDAVTDLIVRLIPENPALIANSAVTGTSFGRTIDLQAAYELGTTRIQVRVTDGAGSIEEKSVDYRVLLPEAVDFGDAPGIYPVLLADHGAWHVARPAFRLGAAVDAESNGQPTPASDGDDLSTVGDEDGVQWPATLEAGRTNVVRVTASAVGRLDGWIDLDRDGRWDNATEKVFDATLLNAGLNLLPLTLSSPLPNGLTFARVRFSAAGHLPPDGGAGIGEVEDARVLIASDIEASDFGDAPGSFPTTLAQDGARHRASPLILGPRRDLETDSSSDDNTVGVADDDGVFPVQPLVPGQTTTFRIQASRAGRLDAWIDFNGNAAWDEPEERIAHSILLTEGITGIPVLIPATAVPGTAYARFRLSLAGGLAPTGPADDGEVEDYALTIEGAPIPCPTPPASSRARPNVIVIMADDLGFGDLGCYGSRDIPTPHIDSLATNGVRFTSAYVTAPVCSPSRAGFMTARYQQRFGHETNPGISLERDPHFGLPVTESTLGDRFKLLNYATGWVGKSHLGGMPEFHPQQRGFDDYFGFIESHHDYFDSGEPLAEQHDPILRGTVPLVETNYLTTAFARECVRFIRQHTNQPFLLYAPFNAIHFPLQATPQLLDRAAALNLPDPRRRDIAPVLMGLDDAVGALLATLRQYHLETNTLIFFTSDNGGTVQLGSVNRPLRGGKTEVYEGGIRVPFIMQWLGHLPTNRVLDFPVSTLDILPTAYGAVQAPIPDAWHLDGVDLLPYICNTALGTPHPILFWRIETDGLSQGGDVLDGIRAVREGPWKLVKAGIQLNWELYDLSTDIGETTDLASARPEVVQRLVAAYHAWSAETERPRWAVDDLEFETPEYVREDLRIGATGFSYLDPQFSPEGDQVAFLDQDARLWRGSLDPVTGWFALADGRDHEVDTGLAPGLPDAPALRWGESTSGLSLYYTKAESPNPVQIWRAGPLDPVNSTTPLTALTQDPAASRVGVTPTIASDQNVVRLAFGVGTSPNFTAGWADETSALAFSPLPERVGGFADTHWLPNGTDLVYPANPHGEVVVPNQIARLNTLTGALQYLTDDEGNKSEPWGFLAPEYDGELCLATIVDGLALAIYRDRHDRPGGLLTRETIFRQPTDRPPRRLHTLEPLPGPHGFNGSSYFVCVADDSNYPGPIRDSEIWLLALGTDQNFHILRRLDEGGGSGLPAIRTDPHLMVGRDELRCYYTREAGTNAVQLHLAATGIQGPELRGEPSGFAQLQFEPSFVSGTNDANGQLIHTTETLALVAHQGRLYAAQGSRGNAPVPRTPPELANARPEWTGAQILIKESANSTWRVDPASPAIFRDHLRVETLTELTFETRVGGDPIREGPVTLLVAGLSDVGLVGSRQATARIRRDEPPALWEDSHIATTDTPADALAFGSHRDGGDGTHYAYAGLSNGEIYRGGYDPQMTSRLRWFSDRAELTNAGPVVGFAECNGRLYAATGLRQTVAGGPVDGGLYVRIDTNGTWSLVHQWPHPADLAGPPEDRWLLRGLTAVPEPHGDSRQVLLAARAWPGVIERIDRHPDPSRGHQVTVELDVRDFLARHWNDDRLRGASVTLAYHNFAPAVDPVTGEEVHLVGLWIDAPALSLPLEGSVCLIRHRDATYEILETTLSATPASTLGTRGIRTIVASPFPEEYGTAWYFGGYDTSSLEAHDSAWIVRGIWTAWPRLAISAAETGGWRIEWPAANNDWVLEQSSDAEGADGWRRVEGRPTFQRSRRAQVARDPGANGFFRLHHP